MISWESVYKEWDGFEGLDVQVREQLNKIKNDETTLKEVFYKELTFGTGGVRGILGPGINRMNVYTVRKSIKGLANYILSNSVNVKDRGVVVAYDSRYMSREFALEVAKVLGVYDIKTYVFESIRPTPLLSFAVRFLGTAAGVMITASHNPPQYNGFKVYNEDGGQITLEEANNVIAEIEKVSNGLTVPILEQSVLEEKGLLRWVEDEVDNAYLKRLITISKLSEEKLSEEKDLKITFTPLHGTANDLVMKGLEQLHFPSVEVVEEQAIPDPEFSTVESPNPEEAQAFTLAIEQGKKQDADILLATDPDADRLGIAVRDTNGQYELLTGNQIGTLLLDYILKHSDPVLLNNSRMLKTIVTTELGKKVAESYGVQTIDTLTGFKFIGEKIRQFDSTGETFIFGFEESYGYLISSFARDKDAVQAAMMVCEMAYYWKGNGKTLIDALHGLYEQHGYYREGITSITLEGIEGSEKIKTIMNHIRKEPLKEIAGLKVEVIEDYLSSERIYSNQEEVVEPIDLPKENVVKFLLEKDSWVCLRPSGTEPKIKCYYGVCETNMVASKKQLAELQKMMEKTIATIIETN